MNQEISLLQSISKNLNDPMSQEIFDSESNNILGLGEYHSRPGLIPKYLQIASIIIALLFLITLLFIPINTLLNFIDPIIFTRIFLVFMIIIGIIILLHILAYNSIKKWVQAQPKSRFAVSVQVKKPNINEDAIIQGISNSFNNLTNFRTERLRQARMSFNASLVLIIVGILIVFGGVFMLYKKNITEGALTSAIGGISNIIGGTILKLYKETNNRMDKLDDDLFILETVKVQYTLINSMKKSERDNELKKLIKSIQTLKKY